MEKKLYKPKIGKRIYYIYRGDIIEDIVGYVGADSFIIESYGPLTYMDSWEWYYEDYNKNWFTSLAKAKKKCKEDFGKEYEIYLLND